eukprot:TRINITY_DN4132_c0_g1_i1.p1 TRINITY_DN4132_c0_g1~~TRINITY_DN4132_c0_g1_i1.p1  ORF type:complete len:913 (-),score=221.36 TRINITY_DN4132_c0_g1_i1:68-2806(-)
MAQPASPAEIAAPAEAAPAVNAVIDAADTKTADVKEEHPAAPVESSSSLEKGVVEVKSNITDKHHWFEFFGYATQAAQQDYYKVTLLRQTELQDTPEAVLLVIAEFAADGYDVGTRIDAQDLNNIWCVGEVIDIEHKRIKVHFFGWENRFDEWILKDGNRVAHLFTHTKHPQPINERAKANETTLKNLGFSPEEIIEAMKQENCKGDFQNSVNYAFYQAHLRRLKTKRTLKKGEFQLGMTLDVRDDKFGMWCIAEIVAISEDQLKIHYLGWGEKYDEWLDSDTPRFAPAFTHTKFNQQRPNANPNASPVQSSTLTAIGFSKEEAEDAVKNCENSLQNAFNYAFYHRHLNSENETSPDEKSEVGPTGQDEAFYVGQRIDAKSSLGLWCVAMISIIQPKRVKVRYLGWGSKYDEWIYKGKGRIAPLFTETRYTQSKVGAGNSPSIDFLINAGFSKDEAEEANKCADGELQNALNRAYYLQYRKGLNIAESPAEEDGLMIGERMDVNYSGRWCIGEIMTLQKLQAKVNFLCQGVEEWVVRSQDRFAELFTHTKEKQPKKEDAPERPLELQPMLEAGFSEQEALDAIASSDRDFINAINIAYYAAHQRHISDEKSEHNSLVFVGNRVDCMDARSRWCVGEITEIRKYDLKVVLIGRGKTIAVVRGSLRIAPLFTFTCVPESKQENSQKPDQKALTDLGFSVEEVVEAVKNCEEDMQNAINALMYAAHLRAQDPAYADLLVVGKGVDVLDNFSKWCVAEVLEVNEYAFKVGFLGWTEKYDTWYPKGTMRVAPMFSRTNENQQKISRTPPEPKVLIEMGFNDEESELAIVACGEDLQNAINRVMFMRKLNDQHIPTLKEIAAAREAFKKNPRQFAVKPRENLVANICAMGFSEEQAQIALIMTNNNQEQAVEMLISQL